VTCIAEQSVAQRVFPGCVIGLADRSGAQAILHIGHLTYDGDSPAVSTDTVYDAASLTKVVPTSTLALMALDQGRLALGSRVREFVPELGGPYRDAITVHHLLSHTLDFGFALSSLKDLPGQQLLDRILAAPLRAAPGTRFVYGNATSILLGLVVERVLGDRLDALAKRLVLGPLAMRESRLGRIPAEVLQRTAPSEDDPWRGRAIRGETHDESAWRLGEMMTPGSAGLFTTVPDLLRFLRMVLAGGALDGCRVLGEATVSRIAENQIPHLALCTGLGWEMGQTEWMGSRAEGLIGKTGFTGCAVMADLHSGRGLVMLSNWTWPRRRAGRAEIDQVRRQVAEAVFG